MGYRCGWHISSAALILLNVDESNGPDENQDVSSIMQIRVRAEARTHMKQGVNGLSAVNHVARS
ncbi:MAG: hypothetical protein JXA73_21755 [Acidobacteria bacterium]|nr:hypothetical protein [Acidobacteriota bacterium]